MSGLGAREDRRESPRSGSQARSGSGQAARLGEWHRCVGRGRTGVRARAKWTGGQDGAFVLNKVTECKAGPSRKPFTQTTQHPWVTTERPGFKTKSWTQLLKHGFKTRVILGSLAFSGQIRGCLGWRAGEAGQNPLEQKCGISILI